MKVKIEITGCDMGTSWTQDVSDAELKFLRIFEAHAHAAALEAADGDIGTMGYTGDIQITIVES